MGSIIALPDLASRELRVAAAHAAAIAEARQQPQPKPLTHPYRSGTLWRDLKRGGVVVAHAVTVGMNGWPLFVTVSRPGAPLGQDQIRTPADLAPLYADEVVA